jgi:hypothetical protein
MKFFLARSFRCRWGLYGVAAKWLIIRQIAQLTGIKNTPVTCANALIINNISATAGLPLAYTLVHVVITC